MKSIGFMLGLVAAATGATAAAPVRRAVPITVGVNNERFTPARIMLRRGVSYVLTIRNRSDRRHNFSAPEFFRLARVAPRDAVLVRNDRVDVKAGRSATVHFRAPDTPNAVYRFRSTNLRDAATNMRGEILVR
ncbi:cupredoxin domain-containing protein [Sphingomonas montana]|uniref:cupredoxin domain-containing protein n=1 Tax=Sphingomonas montana TaxID=1843236 RepID=UPI00096FCA75|nr:cupredoxin domain-containing protein [Sphingomonas montana]